jgi:hypothetical protein
MSGWRKPRSLPLFARDSKPRWDRRGDQVAVATLSRRHKARSYGATNIRRFRDGFLLLRYCARAFGRFKLGATPVAGRVARKSGMQSGREGV